VIALAHVASGAPGRLWVAPAWANEPMHRVRADAEVRASANARAASIASITAGSEIVVLQHERGWRQVRTASGQLGWVADAALEGYALRNAATPVGDARTVTAIVSESSGLPDVPAGTSCTLAITPPESGGLFCASEMTCGSTEVYAGAFACELLGGVIASDAYTSEVDTDAMFSLDTRAGTFEMSDTSRADRPAFRLRARVDPLR
jgi:hypothetical protein